MPVTVVPATDRDAQGATGVSQGVNPHDPRDVPVSIDATEIPGGGVFNFVYGGRTDTVFREVAARYTRVISDQTRSSADREKAAADMFRELNDRKNSAAPAPPPEAPHPDPAPVQAPVVPTPANAGRDADAALERLAPPAALAAPAAPGRPRVRVEFLFGTRGDSQYAAYADALIHDATLVLVADAAAYAAGFYVPPAHDREPALAVRLPGIAAPVPVVHAGLVFPYGDNHYLVLAVDRTRE